MKLLRLVPGWLAALALLASLFGNTAQAAQGSGCLPTVGTVSGLTMTNDMIAAIAALISSNSGASAPSTDCTAAPVLGQFWLDTTSSQYRKLKYFDGSSWLVVATLDSTNHLTIEPIGGGNASIASATTTDLWSTPEASITVTGATTITQLASASAVPGTMKLVQFAGALTLTYDATKLILPTAANITTAAGDYAVVLALSSTNVAVISYNRASGSALAASNSSVGSAAFAASAIGMNMPNNLQLNVTAAGNNLTIAVKGVNGSDPSASSPVTVAFRDQTLANGTEIFGQITGALSFTINSGNTMGTSSGVPARLWVELICQTQSGTTCTSVLLGASIQSTATSCLPLVEGNTVSTGSGTNGGSTAGTIYTSAASLSGKASRIAGYVEITEATAGTWATGATLVHVLSPGDKKPCDVVQTVYGSTTTPTSVSSNAKTTTALSAAISPTSAANLVKVQADGLLNTTSGSGSGAPCLAQLYRSTTGTPIGNISPLSVGTSSSGSGPTHTSVLDNPATTSSTTYGVMIFYSTGTAGTVTFLGTANSVGTNTGAMTIDEIMGSLEPANDISAPLSAVG